MLGRLSLSVTKELGCGSVGDVVKPWALCGWLALTKQAVCKGPSVKAETPWQ